MITLKGTTVTIHSSAPMAYCKDEKSDEIYNPEIISRINEAYVERRNRIKKAWKERKKANKAKQKDIWL